VFIDMISSGNLKITKDTILLIEHLPVTANTYLENIIDDT